MQCFFDLFRNPTVLLVYGIMLYTVILMILRPKAEAAGKMPLFRLALFLPLIAVLVHCGFFWLHGQRYVYKVIDSGDSFQRIYRPMNFKLYPKLYAAALLPLVLLISLRKKPVRRMISAALCLGLGYCALFQQFGLLRYTHVHNFTHQSWTEGFRQTVAAMEKEYILSDWKQIDYQALLETYLPRVQAAEQAEDSAAFGAVLTEFTHQFYDQHVKADMELTDLRDTKDVLSGNDYGLTLFQTDSGEMIAVMVDEESSAYAAGIRNGTVITAWDCVLVREAAAQVSCVYPNQRMQFAVRANEDVYRPLFLSGKGGDTVRVTFRNGQDAESEAVLSSAGSGRKRLSSAITQLQHDWIPDANFSTRMISDTCGYLRITDEAYQAFFDYIAYMRKGRYPKLTNDISEKLDALRAQGMQSLVIDLRNNNGGLHVVGTAVSSLFTEEQRFQAAEGRRQGNTFRSTFRYDVFPDGRWKDLPVVVLVNQATMSAGDSTALFLGQNENVTLMGVTAGSGVTQAIGGKCFLSSGFSVCYPVHPILGENSQPLIDTDASRENRVPLDHVIPVDRDAALRIFDLEADEADDFELDYAMQYLQSSVK